VQIPAVIIQGDTVTWRDRSTSDKLGNAIGSSWTLTWKFSGPSVLSVVASADGSGWETTLSSAQTAALTAAPSRAPNYFWQAQASKAGVRHTIGHGELRIVGDMANNAAGYSGLSQAEQDLAAVQGAIRTRISGGLVQEYTIGTRQLKNEPMTELIKLESRLKLIVGRERRARLIANGSGDPRNTFVRFT
jgi:hypothetical protein